MVAISYFANKNVVNLRLEGLAKPMAGADVSYDRHWYEQYPDNPHYPDFVKGLFQIKALCGVSLSFSGREIHLSKSWKNDWKEILPAVLILLHDHFDYPGGRIALTRPTTFHDREQSGGDLMLLPERPPFSKIHIFQEVDF